MEEMLYVFLFTFFLQPLIFTLVAASISHVLTAAKKFSRYSSNEIGLLCFLYLILALSLLFLFFISKSLDGYVIYCRNMRVLEMQNFIPPYMKGWTYIQTIFSEPKLLGCIDNQIFLPMVLCCRRFAHESSTIKLAGG